MPLPTPPQTLQDLIDRARILDTLMAYATGIDRRDWALYRSIFADEVDFDFTSWSGLKMRMKADDWLLAVQDTLSCFDATQHTLSNPVVSLDGDSASVVAHMTALHYLVTDGISEIQMLGGYYDHRMVRTGDGWQIAACRLVITFEQGDRGLFDRAKLRGPIVA